MIVSADRARTYVLIRECLPVGGHFWFQSPAACFQRVRSKLALRAGLHLRSETGKRGCVRTLPYASTIDLKQTLQRSQAQIWTFCQWDDRLSVVSVPFLFYMYCFLHACTPARLRSYHVLCNTLNVELAGKVHLLTAKKHILQTGGGRQKPRKYTGLLQIHEREIATVAILLVSYIRYLMEV